MAILLESKFSLLSVTCVINLLCDLTPIYLYLYLLPLLHTHPAAQQPSWPWLFLPPGLCSFLCLRRPLRDPTLTLLLFYNPFRYLLSPSSCPIWIICTFSVVLFASVGFSAFSMQPLLLVLWSLVVFLLMQDCVLLGGRDWAFHIIDPQLESDKWMDTRWWTCLFE